MNTDKYPPLPKPGVRIERGNFEMRDYAAAAVAADRAARGVPDGLFEKACRVHTDFAVNRYLMSCADGRQDGAEKALRHRELCSFYVAISRGYSDPEVAAREREDDYMAVHSETQKLTDYMDEVIGFPLKGRPDYSVLAPAFFKKFHALALGALSAPQPAAQPTKQGVPDAMAQVAEMADYSGTWWDSAMETIRGYRSEMNAIHERESPTWMGEPVIDDNTRTV